MSKLEKTFFDLSVEANRLMWTARNLNQCEDGWDFWNEEREKWTCRFVDAREKSNPEKSKDPRCPYCDRPVILNTGTILVSGLEGTYHARCTEPPSEVEFSSGHLKVRRKNN